MDSRKGVVAALGALLVVALVGAAVAGARDDPERGSSSASARLDPAPVDYAPPRYAARVPGGLLVRRGSESRVLRDVLAFAWLPDGSHLVEVGRREPCAGGAPDWCGTRLHYLLDPSTTQIRRLTRKVDATIGTTFLPSVTPWGPSMVLADRTLWRATPDLSRRLPDVQLPPVDGAARERSFGETVAVGDATYVEFADLVADGSEEYGYLRVGGDRVDKVLLGERIADLWVSSDGSALLGTQQVEGEPCGGCVVDQDIVEIDPVTGEILENYGVPDGYDRWGVEVVDKVDGRIAVRYRWGRPHRTQLWVHEDGEWSLDEASENVPTWWQGPDDRIELRPGPKGVPDRGTLVWVHDGVETRLPGRGATYAFDVPGSLLPPSG